MTIENEEKKKYLNSYRTIQRKIESLEIQGESIRLDMTSVKAIQYSDMPKGNKQSDLADLIIQLEKVETKIKDRKAELIKIKTNIEQSINDLQDGLQSDVLRMRYIENYGWEDIAYNLDKSKRHTIRIHGYGLNNLKIN